jgi:twitching motility protein PilT
MNLIDLLNFAYHQHASDLHLSSEQAPLLRIDGKLERLGSIALTHDKVMTFINELLTEPQRSSFLTQKYLDFSLNFSTIGRCRVNIFLHQHGAALSLRLINAQLPQLEMYTNFLTFKRLLEADQGLILLVGSTGSGKTTTLNAMIDYLNRLQAKHVIMLEDPIEYVHTSQKSLIHQRELSTHIHSFADGIKSALREDPDVLLIGELRDREAMRYALQASETGHLVLATLHANGAAKALDRIIQTFSSDEQTLIRLLLAESLLGILYQTLVVKIHGQGRMPIQEILLASPAIKNLIREHKIPQIEASMETSQLLGMQTMAQALKKFGAHNAI